jgi:hypothetical protein
MMRIGKGALTGGIEYGIVGASHSKEDDMYSAFTFNQAKIDLAYSYFQKPSDSIGQVEIAFLRSLLSAAAQRGCVSDQDVQRAIEQSGACDLEPEIADRMIEYLWNIGDDYVGALSAAQAAELRRLRKLCILAAATGDRDAWSQIGEILWGNSQ